MLALVPPALPSHMAKFGRLYGLPFLNLLDSDLQMLNAGIEQESMPSGQTTLGYSRGIAEESRR